MASGDDFVLGNFSDPNVAVLDIGNTENAAYYVEGTTADLIRDGYDNPQPWMHNAHADPEDDRLAFLVGRGWSATLERRQALYDLNIPTMAINDYPSDGPRPWYWCSGDGPGSFGTRIWDDPDVMKFCALGNKDEACPREDAYVPKQTPRGSPNVCFYHKVNDLLSLEEWLFLPYISWGTTLFGKNVPPQFHKEGAARSSMLVGMRILWHLGYRRVCLLGCDCTPHHHPAPNYWKVMFALIEKLKPAFDHYGYRIFHTNIDSHLRTFPFVNFWKVMEEWEREHA
jgi:hypothetical protein